MLRLPVLKNVSQAAKAGFLSAKRREFCRRESRLRFAAGANRQPVLKDRQAEQSVNNTGNP